MTIYSYFLIILAILPSLLISSFVYKKDKHKEPISILILLFTLGACSTFVVAIISYILEITFPVLAKNISDTSFFELLIQVFLEVALLEELCKWFIIYIFGYKNKKFNETYDIILYSVLVGLGFATWENLLFVFENYSIQTALFRGILSVPGHVAFQIFMSYYLCMAKISEIKISNKDKVKNILKSILIPSLLHGIYDFCLFTKYNLFLILFLVFVIIMFIKAFNKLRNAYESNVSLKEINII